MAAPLPGVAGKEPVVTKPLLAFALAVATALAVGFAANRPPADAAAAVRALADGDLDGAECQRAYARILADADAATTPAATWAVGFAALALGDADAWAKAAAAIARDVAEGIAPAPAERRFLDLGDPLLGAVRDAYVAESARDAAAAKAAWARARAVADLTGRALPREV
ncbi:MAG: hypothetical protein FJ301_11460, partial [Planctomycetes bacterium]|nr:hypothetical protein [Planctomycetota bacterium]